MILVSLNELDSLRILVILHYTVIHTVMYHYSNILYVYNGSQIIKHL